MPNPRPYLPVPRRATVVALLLMLGCASPTALATDSRVDPATASAVAVEPEAAAEARAEQDPNRSPAICGPTDTPEPGIQGEVPQGEQAKYQCGLTLLGELPSPGGAVQGSGHCAYVRYGKQIHVVDVSDPRRPTEVGAVPVFASGRPQLGGDAAHGSETLRAVVTPTRAVLVSGGTVYDIRNCRKPVLKGQIDWADGVYEPGGEAHDIRVSKDATTVYATFGLKEADISNLNDPETWTVTDHTCGIEAQLTDQPLSPVHGAAGQAGIDPCDHGYEPVTGAGQLSHGPDTNGDDTRVYIGAQNKNERTLTLLDATAQIPRVISRVPSTPGHSIDWFRPASGGEYLLSANELGAPATPCLPQAGSNDVTNPRDPAGTEAYLTNITAETTPKRASVLQVAINKPENCRANVASRALAFIAYHSLDNPLDPHFAMIAWGTAGLRLFDIRRPEKPTEAAYFNHGSLPHAGVAHYDAARGLLYAPNSGGLKIVGIQPHIFDQLGMKPPAQAWFRTDAAAATGAGTTARGR